SFMVPLQLLTVEEIHATKSTFPFLLDCQLQIALGQISSIYPLSRPPVFSQLGVVWRGPAAHHYMADYPEPIEFEEVLAGVLVPDPPPFAPPGVHAPPFFLSPPLCRFPRVVPVDITSLAVEHPLVHLLKDTARNYRAVIVRPPSDDGIEVRAD